MFSSFYLFCSYLFYSSAQMWGKRGVWCFSCSLNLNIPAFISILTFRSICSIAQLYHFVSVPSLLFSCVIFTLSLGRKRQQSIQKRCENHHGCVWVCEWDSAMFCFARSLAISSLLLRLSLSLWKHIANRRSDACIYDQFCAFIGPSASPDVFVQLSHN